MRSLVYARDHARLGEIPVADVVLKAVRPGDVVMVKGSAGARMGLIASRLKALAKHKKGKT